MTRTKLTRGQLAVLRELPAELRIDAKVKAVEVPKREAALLGLWRNAFCGSLYELSWLDNQLKMRRAHGDAPAYVKSAEEFERLLSYGCFIRPDASL